MEIFKVKKQKFSACGGPAFGWKKIIKIIKEGGVIICPTDTVYGLVADATNEKAVRKIFEIKKRPKEKAIPIFVKDIEMAKKLAFINKKQEKFLRKVWFTPLNNPARCGITASRYLTGPGKLTAVLKRKSNCGLPKILFGNKKTIALRIPNYKLVNLLLEKLNKPLTGTSANISGKPPSTKIKEVLRQFENHPPSLRLRRAKKHQPDLVISAGNLPKNKPSRIVDLTGEKVKILRW